MNILDSLYLSAPANSKFFARKLQLPSSGSFEINGARGVGKTSLILDYISQLKEEEYLYIDCQEPIFALEDIDYIEIDEFIIENGIKTVILDHYFEGFIQTLPRAKQIIILSRVKSEFDLTSYTLYPLDYEEFLGFDKSSIPSSSFNRLLKHGTLPSIANTSNQNIKLELKSLFFERFDTNESRLILILARFHGKRVTPYKLYTYAKEYFKISKDWVYKRYQQFIKEGLIIELEDIEKRSGKRVYMYDFVLPKYLNPLQSFPTTFDSLVVLALYKHQIEFLNSDGLGYILPKQNIIITPAPFESEEQFWKKAHKFISRYQRKSIKRVNIVTVSSSYTFTIANIVFEAMPFFEWSILNEEDLSAI